MKRPKNIAKYEESLHAGMRLIHFALQQIFPLKPGIKVKWSITISLWSEDWLDPEKTKDMKVLPMSSTYSNLG
jgi:hypothetical protein